MHRVTCVYCKNPVHLPDTAWTQTHPCPSCGQPLRLIKPPMSGFANIGLASLNIGLALWGLGFFLLTLAFLIMVVSCAISISSN